MNVLIYFTPVQKLRLQLFMEVCSIGPHTFSHLLIGLGSSFNWFGLQDFVLKVSEGKTQR